MQNTQILKENENLKLQVQELRFQIQAQLVAFALQIPELRASLPPQLLPDRAFVPVPKPMAQPQTAMMNTVATPFIDGEQMMAMKAFQVTNGSCEWEELW
jgi:hypothetical protein